MDVWQKKNGWQTASRELLFPGRFPRLEISTGELHVRKRSPRTVEFYDSVDEGAVLAGVE